MVHVGKGSLIRRAFCPALLALLACSGPDDDFIEGVGTVEVREIDIAPLIPARVTRVLVDEGDRVRAGDTLVLLTQAAARTDVEIRRSALARAEALLRDLEAGARPAEMAQATAEVTAAEAEAARLERDLERAVALAASGSITNQELEGARSRATVAVARRNSSRQARRLLAEGSRPERINAGRSEVATARAALDAARENAAELALTASEDGAVLARLADPGEALSAGQPAVTIGRTDSLWVRVYVSPGAVARLQVGDLATAVLDDFPERRFSGRVAALNPRAEFTPRVALTERERADLLFGVKVNLDDKTGTLKPGLPVTVRITPRS